MIHATGIIYQYMTDPGDGSVTKHALIGGEWVSLGESELPKPKRSQKELSALSEEFGKRIDDMMFDSLTRGLDDGE